MLVDRAVAEVEPDDVDAGAHHRLEHRRVLRCRPERGDDLRAARHSCLSSRSMDGARRPQTRRSLRAHLDASPSPWHAVRTSAERLRAAGFVELDEREPWVEPPDAGFVVRGGALIAWRRPAGAGALPVRIVGAHTDSPGLRDQAEPRRRRRPGGASSASRSTAACCSTAGSTATSASPAVSSSPTGSQMLVDVAEPIARVPQLAIHLDRDVNERGLVLDRQAHMSPVWATALDQPFAAWIAERAGTAEAGGVGAVPVRRAAGSRARRRSIARSPAAGSTTWRRAGRRRARSSRPASPSTWR